MYCIQVAYDRIGAVDRGGGWDSYIEVPLPPPHSQPLVHLLSFTCTYIYSTSTLKKLNFQLE